MAALCLLVECLTLTPRVDARLLHTFHSQHYTIHTNLTAAEMRPFASHMDLVFDNYQKRFANFHASQHGPLQFYLLGTRKQYLQFLAMHGIDAANSGGMFFVTSKIHGLATWAFGRSRLRAFAILQHEGFHQFAFYYIGRDLPPWANEGIAQYFEDGIIVHGQLLLGLADKRRLDIVQSAIDRRHFVPISKLVDIDGQRWDQILQEHPQISTLLYAEAWDMVYFLIHGNHGRYCAAFEKYLHLVADGEKSRVAFGQAFGTKNFNMVQRSWLRFAVNQHADPLSMLVNHLDFLGRAIKYLIEQHVPVPRSVGTLRNMLQGDRFELIYRSDGINHTVSADDNSIYRYRRSNGQISMLRMIQPRNSSLPPGLTAPGVRPQPTLVWSRDHRGRLALNIVYR